MEPQLGWAWLSQKERRTAEQALAVLGPDGTRDELGFGVIHFAYADRFFPGTSVQHTALRYIWFTCWAYQELEQRSPGQAFPRGELEAIEDRTGHRLIKHYGAEDGHGIIGGRVLRVFRSPVVKPSTVYWNAMRSWGLVEPLAAGREAPGRAEIHARWPELTARAKRPEVDAIRPRSLFSDAPPVPPRWRSASEPLTFELDSGQDEAGRIRRAWARQRDQRGRATLLSRLAERGRGAPNSMHAREVLGLCFADEKVSLIHARCAAALVGVARAVHTALVQRLKDEAAPAMAEARRWVDDAAALFSQDALALEVASLVGDVPEAAKLIPLIEATKEWLNKGAGDLARLEPIYREREEAQKPGRALLTRSGGDRRSAWTPRPTGPLTYRWDTVAGFLDQLEGR